MRTFYLQFCSKVALFDSSRMHVDRWYYLHTLNSKIFIASPGSENNVLVHSSTNCCVLLPPPSRVNSGCKWNDVIFAKNPEHLIFYNHRHAWTSLLDNVIYGRALTWFKKKIRTELQRKIKHINSSKDFFYQMNEASCKKSK